jgi:hypothetical protein
MSIQEIYEKSRTHLLTQNAKSHEPDNEHRCLYRGPNGLMCGAGPFIPDDKYVPEMEGMVFSAVVDKYDLPYTPLETSLINRIQSIHDWDAIELWPLRLEAAWQDYSNK